MRPFLLVFLQISSAVISALLDAPLANLNSTLIFCLLIQSLKRLLNKLVVCFININTLTHDKNHVIVLIIYLLLLQAYFSCFLDRFFNVYRRAGKIQPETMNA